MEHSSRAVTDTWKYKYDDNDDDDGDGDDDDGFDWHLKVLVRRDSKPLRRVEELILWDDVKRPSRLQDQH